MKVTFDKNVYEFVVDPEKESDISLEARDCYRKIHSLIVAGKIFPFISETILTYEVIRKDDRKAILSHHQPIVVTSDEDTISTSSNPIVHPGNSCYESFYLPKAINIGFRVLPDRRFGKLINPAVKSSWYYLKDEDYFIVSDRFSSILSDLDSLNVGYKAYSNIWVVKKI